MSEPMMAPSADETGEATGWQERRGLIAVAGIAVVALLGLGAWFLVFSGDEPEDGLVASARTATATVTPETPATEPEQVEELPEAFELDLGNDPFKPLYEPVAEAETVDPGAGVGAQAPLAPVGTDPAGTAGVLPGVVPGDQLPQPGSQPQAPAQPGGGVTVELVSADLKTQNAVLLVDGEQVKVGSGETFGPGRTLTLHRITDDANGRGAVTVYQGDDLEGTGATIVPGSAHSF